MKNPIFLALAACLLLCHCRGKETPPTPDPDAQTPTVANTRNIVVGARTGGPSPPNYSINLYSYSNGDPTVYPNIASDNDVTISISDNDVLLFSADGHTPVTIDFVSGSGWIEELKLYMRNASNSTTCDSSNKTLSGTAKARLNDSSFQPVSIVYHRNGRQIQNVGSNSDTFGYTININDTIDNQCIKDLRFTTNNNGKARIFITSVSSDNIELDVFLDDSTSGVPGSDTAPTNDSKEK